MCSGIGIFQVLFEYGWRSKTWYVLCIFRYWNNIYSVRTPIFMLKPQSQLVQLCFCIRDLVARNSKIGTRSVVTSRRLSRSVYYQRSNTNFSVGSIRRYASNKRLIAQDSSSRSSLFRAASSSVDYKRHRTYKMYPWLDGRFCTIVCTRICSS